MAARRREREGPLVVIGPSASVMGVGFVCSEYPAFRPSHGGIGSVVQTLARALVDRGHRATVYGFNSRKSESVEQGVRLVTIPRTGVWSSLRAMRRQLSRDMAAGLVDVVESSESEALTLPGGRGSVVRLHGSHHFWCATLPQPRRYRRLLLEQVAIRRVSGLCAVSQFAADVTRASMHLGERPIDVLPNPVDTTTFAPRPESVVPGRVVFAGSIMRKKGVHELCLSMAHLLQRHPSAELRVIGRDVPGVDGDLRETILRDLAPSVRSHVHFLGALPRHEVSREMAAAHVCALPSHMETQGLVFVEAMACGRPVVAPGRGPGPEVVGVNDECGLLVDPSDPRDIAAKIGRVLDDPALAERLGLHGRQRALEQFSVSTCLVQNLEFYGRQRHVSTANGRLAAQRAL